MMAACSATHPQWGGPPGWEPTPASPKNAPGKGKQALTIRPLGSHSKDTVDLLSPFSQGRNKSVYWFL